MYANSVSNAELEEIFLLAEQGREGYSAKQWHDHDTNSDIMTYGTRGKGMTDWAAYMSDLTKETRTEWIEGLNFGGTSDWAVDLGQWFRGTEEDKPNNAKGNSDHLECDSYMFPSSLEELDEDLSYIEPQCRGMALMHVLLEDLDVSIREYENVSKNKDYQDRVSHLPISPMTYYDLHASANVGFSSPRCGGMQIGSKTASIPS